MSDKAVRNDHLTLLMPCSVEYYTSRREQTCLRYSSYQVLCILYHSRWSLPWVTGWTRHVPTRTNVLVLHCHFYLGARQVKSDCTVEASGFIGISQRLNGTSGLLSLFHTEPTLPGGVKQSMKLIYEYLWPSQMRPCKSIKIACENGVDERFCAWHL